MPSAAPGAEHLQIRLLNHVLSMKKVPKLRHPRLNVLAFNCCSQAAPVGQDLYQALDVQGQDK